MLKGITWDHPRGLDPLVAACQELAEATGGAVRVAWETRSLHDFESIPLAEFAGEYDLLAIDHPFVGQASADGCLIPMESLLDCAFLTEIAADSVGPSTNSYRWGGSLWALPMDVAAQVSAYRPGIVDQPPQTWSEVAQLAGDIQFVLPANPVHLWSTFVTLSHQHASGAGPVADYPYSWWDDSGFGPDACVPALELLAELVRSAHPRSWWLDPIGALDLMAAGAGPAYAPAVFGYANYARLSATTHRIAFTDVPTVDGGRRGSMLGGVGLAISRYCSDLAAATRVLRHVLDAECQGGTYVAAGGQPGRRTAWTSPTVNELCPDFFIATLPTLDNAFVRPRHVYYPEFQRVVAQTLHQALQTGRPSRLIVDDLGEIWRVACDEH